MKRKVFTHVNASEIQIHSYKNAKDINVEMFATYEFVQ